MDILADITKSRRAPGQFEGRFLVSMPDMESDMFANSVVYICAHSTDGAVGFIVNRPSAITMAELLSLAHVPADDVLVFDRTIAGSPVREGGPVETNRGFVLHGADYTTSSTVNVGKGLFLTSTIEVLRAIAKGEGPKDHVVMLGYAGWGQGQLEAELASNSWLVVDADKALVLDADNEAKYGAALANIGINPANFVGAAGRA